MIECLELARLGLTVVWRKSKLVFGRVFWFYIGYWIGERLFDSELAACALGTVAAVTTLFVAVSGDELAASVESISDPRALRELASELHVVGAIGTCFVFPIIGWWLGAVYGNMLLYVGGSFVAAFSWWGLCAVASWRLNARATQLALAADSR